MRQRLIATYGEATDRNWFSKLEAVENVKKNEIKLKSPNSFIRDWIERNYEQSIKQTAGVMGVMIKRLES